ncbi:MAG: type II toxin-antitoxin system antitoxin DNA ADP-ribosyl glycohydrolase DarG [Acidimicrobiales bacterium]
MITNAHGNLLEADVEALVNTVNTVGVMGKGIALQFARAFPAMLSAYEKAAKRGEVRLGEMHVWANDAMSGPRWVINFPTKGHWRARSRMIDIESGLADLVRVIREHGITSVAIPPLGCGNGGLRWTDVRPLIEHALADLSNVDVRLYPPAGAPTAEAMPTRTRRPSWTPGKAALVAIVARYSERALDVSLIEVQKLMYFLQVAGEPLRLKFERGIYGPYADNLRHSLGRVEGHFLTGFGDASSSVTSAEPISLIEGAAEEAEAELSALPATRARIERVLALSDGFETAYGMELLATVHWVATTHETGTVHNAASASELISKWSQRKKGMFGPDHVEAAWRRLHDEGWFEARDDG